jgi:ABC-type cobalamin transport system ATPase subunit
LEKALNSLESKLRSLKEFLPRADRRRGLINIGGAALKWLFGSATMSDLNALQSTVDTLHRKEEAIAHSLDQQVTYLRQLDGTVKFNFQAVTNLSEALKEVAHKAKEEFQDIAAKLAWSDKQREVVSAIKEIEYALVRLEASVVELIEALEFVTLGKIPLNLVKSKL